IFQSCERWKALPNTVSACRVLRRKHSPAQEHGLTLLVDHLPELAAKARDRVKRGYYDSSGSANASRRSLVKAIQESRKTPVITEIKYASPSAGKIRESGNPLQIAKAMLNGGASVISVLTDDENFDGKYDTLVTISWY